MARPISVLVATLVFSLLGLLIGWLSIQATAQAPGSRVGVDELLVAYLFAPLAGTVLGFVLAVMTFKMFGPRA